MRRRDAAVGRTGSPAAPQERPFEGAGPRTPPYSRQCRALERPRARDRSRTAETRRSLSGAGIRFTRARSDHLHGGQTRPDAPEKKQDNETAISQYPIIDMGSARACVGAPSGFKRSPKDLVRITPRGLDLIFGDSIFATKATARPLDLRLLAFILCSILSTKGYCRCGKTNSLMKGPTNPRSKRGSSRNTSTLGRTS